jgi:hypothetical protein
MGQLWLAERVADADLALALIREQFPGLDAGRIEALLED